MSDHALLHRPTTQPLYLPAHPPPSPKPSLSGKPWLRRAAPEPKRAKVEGSTGLALGPAPPSPVLHVRGLPEDATEAELLGLGQRFGPVDKVMVMTGKGQGFVEYATREAAAWALHAATATSAPDQRSLRCVPRVGEGWGGSPSGCRLPAAPRRRPTDRPRAGGGQPSSRPLRARLSPKQTLCGLR